MKSDYIKCALSSYFRFKRQCKYIATEAGQFSADFVAISKGALIEVEIKTSRSDLNADFKKPKHMKYKMGNHEWVPNSMYFAVPRGLVEHAMVKCAPYGYGVLVVDEAYKTRRSSGVFNSEALCIKHLKVVERYNSWKLLDSELQNSGKLKVWYEVTEEVPWHDRVRVVKRAYRITTRPVSAKVKEQLIARLSSEMAGLRQKSLKQSTND